MSEIVCYWIERLKDEPGWWGDESPQALFTWYYICDLHPASFREYQVSVPIIIYRSTVGKMLQLLGYMLSFYSSVYLSVLNTAVFRCQCLCHQFLSQVWK